jgi:hypothetical protein
VIALIKEVDKRIKTVRVFLVVCGVFLLMWWPLAHWFYSDFYHQLLGFQPGSYQDNMVKVIGTCGAIPVALCLLASRDPIRNRDMILVLIGYGFIQALTYLYLILHGSFPIGESINIGICVVCSLLLAVIFPWKECTRINDKNQKSYK